MDNTNQQPLPSQQQREQVPAPAPLPSSGTSKTSIVLLVIILIVGVGVISFILGTRQNQPVVQKNQATAPPTPTQPSPTPVDETANWKTYNETTHKFLIKYPDSWIVTPYDYKKNPVASVDQPQLIVSFVNKSFTGVELGTPGLIDVGIVYIKPKVSFAEFLTQEKKSASNPVSGNADISDNVINVAGAQSHEVTYKYHDFTNNKVYVLRDESVYIITSQYLNQDSYLGNEFDQILSTFKFLDENQSPSPTPDFNPAIEEEGKLKVQNTPEVQTLIGKYGKSNVSIKALDVKLVKDIQFIMRLDPRFKEQTGCIIVVEVNNTGYVYQLDKDNEILYRQTLEEFKQKTASVSKQTLEKFYSSLK